MAESGLPQQRLEPDVQQNFDYLEQAQRNVAATASAAIPVGAMLQWATGAAPTGWLICDGSVVSQTTYDDLYALWGTTWNTGGEGAGNFRLIDLRGRVPVGVDAGAGRVTGATLGASGGAEAHVLGTAEMPSHTHTVTDPGHSHTYSRPGLLNLTAGGLSTNGGNFGTAATSTSSTGITIGNAGGDGAHNNLQPFIVINFIVKAA